LAASEDRRHHVKVRRAGRIVSVAVIVAVGVNSDDGARFIALISVPPRP
jgi:transposase-like protein